MTPTPWDIAADTIERLSEAAVECIEDGDWDLVEAVLDVLVYLNVPFIQRRMIQGSTDVE